MDNGCGGWIGDYGATSSEMVPWRRVDDPLRSNLST
jgi:hypothetical protein